MAPPLAELVPGRVLRSRCGALEHGVPLQLLVKSGAASSTIVETARELHADLLVTGAHRLPGLEGMLVGSVAGSLARKSPCPVLVVPPGSPAGHG